MNSVPLGGLTLAVAATSAGQNMSCMLGKSNSIANNDRVDDVSLSSYKTASKVNVSTNVWSRALLDDMQVQGISSTRLLATIRDVENNPGMMQEFLEGDAMLGVLAKHAFGEVLS
ncbi:hypothetical protein GOP47_0009933 [Adiantum capillus-veneris]|uniref:Uncharacterized protein n=1 Tax=Adiantum capillus-veneris TaxID=13818 RepID=A0A9D4UY18_ADICA|nr:hypothetical protein GOP47_0009933 [Adiantum capillus-veneris]